jgi:hypothetical protein
MPGSRPQGNLSKSMSDCNEELTQTDEQIVFRGEVSDEALEAASVVTAGFPTLAYGTYCFACPSIVCQQSYSAKTRRGGLRRISAKLPDLLLGVESRGHA